MRTLFDRFRILQILNPSKAPQNNAAAFFQEDGRLDKLIVAHKLYFNIDTDFYAYFKVFLLTLLQNLTMTNKRQKKFHQILFRAIREANERYNALSEAEMQKAYEKSANSRIWEDWTDVDITKLTHNKNHRQ